MEHVEAAMTPDYLSNLLGTKVVSVKIDAGSNPGDNYMCVVYSIKAQLADGESRHFVLKAFPNHSARQAWLEISNVFLKEFVVYDFWFPTFRKLQEELGHPGAFKLGVPPYLDGAAIDNPVKTMGEVAPGATDKPANQKPNILENFLLMEDVREKGFRMANRIKGLDANHSKLVLKELGKLHAFSWVYKNKKGIPSLIAKYPYMEERMFSDDLANSFKPLFDQIVDSTTKLLAETLPADSPILNNFKELMDMDTKSYMDCMQDFINPTGVHMDKVENRLRVKTQFPEGYNKEPWLVACHGDCWVNNFLFRYKDDNKENPNPIPEEIMVLDFQIFREACPTIDLAYFLYSSTTAATRKAHLEELLQTYHDSFLEVCQTLDTPPLPGFSMESLKIRFRQAGLYGLMMSLPLLHAVLKNPDTAEDLDKLDEGGEIGDVFSKGMMGQNENSLLRDRIHEVAVDIYNQGVL